MASLSVIPSSPNWYCSKCCDCSFTGLFAFSARSSIYLYDVSGKHPSYRGNIHVGEDRVTGLVFKHNRAGDEEDQLASVSDDGVVKVWDLTSKTVLHEHLKHNRNKITAVDWSPASKDVIVSGDEQGCVVMWNLSSNSAQLLLRDSGHIFCLSCAPHSWRFVALGYKSGAVLVLDAAQSQGKVLHRLKGHDLEIHSLCWHPGLGAHSDGPFAEGVGLASGSRDRTIRLWDLSKERTLHTLKLPAKASGYRGRDRGNSEGQKARAWLSLYWSRSKELISSSHSGDIVLWNLHNQGEKAKMSILGQAGGLGHSRIVFNICYGGATHTIITTSMDRQIIKWDLVGMRAAWSLPTLGGFVYSLAASPVDLGYLALGVGDGTIRVWNTGSAGNPLDLATLWQGIMSKVTTLAWHPSKEGNLAYGTEDGRVGIVNVLLQRQPIVFDTYHKKTVYSLSWGPPCPNSDKSTRGQGFHIYSCCGGGSILERSPHQAAKDAVDVNSLLQFTNKFKYKVPTRTELSWNVEKSILAIGNDDGSVELFAAPNLKLLCSIKVHRKPINTLRWRPTTAGKGGAGHQDLATGVATGDDLWLAVASNDPVIHVYNLDSALGGSSGPAEGGRDIQVITESTRQLAGHGLRVTGLCWSPHGDQRLVSASYDATAQVWDVATGKPQANFRGHQDRVFTVSWSPLDPDLVYSGGDDFTAHQWRVSQQQHSKPPLGKKEFKSGYNQSKSGSKSRKSRSGGPARTAAPAKDNSATTVNSHPPSSSNSHQTKGATGIATLKKEQSEERSGSSSSSLSSRDERTVTSQHLADIAEPTTPQASAARGGLTSQQPASHPLPAPALQGLVSGSHLLQQVFDSLASAPAKTEDNKGPAPNEGGGDGGVVGGSSSGLKKRKKAKALFPLSSQQDNRGKGTQHQDCLLLAASLNNPATRSESGQDQVVPGLGNHVNLGFFADRKSAFLMLEEEARHHQEQGSFEQWAQLEVVRGNTSGVLKAAEERGQLNDWLVSLAPLAGYDHWLHVVDAYAKQLVTQELYTKAALYYLAGYQIQKAIDILCQQKLYREALAIAKSRLSPSDPHLKEVYLHYASQLEREKSFTQAAKCYLAVNKPHDAVVQLSRKGDTASLRTAMEVALCAGEKEAAVSVISQFVHECQLHSNWSEAFEVLGKDTDWKYHMLSLVVHESLVKCFLRMKLLDENLYSSARYSPQPKCDFERTKRFSLLTSLFGHNGRRSHYGGRRPGDEGFDCFVEYVAAVWAAMLDECTGDAGAALLAAVYSKLSSRKQLSIGGESSPVQILIHLAHWVSLGILGLMTSQVSEGVSHWVRAVALCYDQGYYYLARGLLHLLVPHYQRTIACLKLLPAEAMPIRPFNQGGHPPDLQIAISCLEAYYYLTLLYCLWWEKPSVLPAVNPLVYDYSQSLSVACVTKAMEEASGEISSDCRTQPTVKAGSLPPVRDTFGGGLGQYCSGLLQAAMREGLGELASPLQAFSCRLADSALGGALRELQERRWQAQGLDVLPAFLSGTAPATLGASVVTALLELSAEALLTDTQAQRASLRGRLQCIQEAVRASVTKHRVKGQGSGSVSVEAALPPDWETLPVDLKYQHPAVTMIILTGEQKKVIEVLQSLPHKLRELSFPDPIEIGLTILWLSKQLVKRGLESSRLSMLTSRVLSWINRQAYTQKQIQYTRTSFKLIL